MIALRKSEELLAWVERSLGHRFADPKLCYAALRHRSAGGDHNERLEFLGDSVLNLSVARRLYSAQPEADEGDLSRLRASLVSGVALAEIAAELGLGDHLLLGSGEMKSGGFRRASILADALEALFGAIYLDAGFDAAAAVIDGVMAQRLSNLPSPASLKDPKTRLQEALQANGIAVPNYSLQSVAGEPHAQSFVIQAEIPSLGLSATGEGASRRGAEQGAASKLLELLPPKVRRSL